MLKKLNLLIAGLLTGIYLTIGIIVLPHYGQNWDEPSHFFRGQAILNYFLTGNKGYDNLPVQKVYHQNDNNVLFDPVGKNKNDIPRRSGYQYSGLGFVFWATIGGGGHPPFSDIAASFFNYIFFQKLGLIADVESYHLYSVFVSSLLVGIIFLWVSDKFGRFTGFFSSLSLALYPLFLSESRFNIKDPPETFFFSLAIICFYEGIVRKKNGWIIFSSLFTAFAFATKFNVAFIIFILLPWLLFFLISTKDKITKFAKIIPSLVLFPILIVGIFFISWPYIWQDPLKNFLNVIDYYKTIGTNSNFDMRYIWYFGINTYAIQWILFSTPIVILVLSLWGTLVSLKNLAKKKDKISLLILLWFAVPIIRVTIPGAGIYGGVRQIMEYVPAMAILSGIGAFSIFKLLHKKFNSRIIPWIFLIVSFIPFFFKLVSLHPNEGFFFNFLIGGFKGAMASNFLDANTDLGNSYKQAIVWVNNNLEKNAKLALFSGLGSDIPTFQLREDIKFANSYRSGFERGGEYVIGIAEDVVPGAFSNPFMYLYYTEALKPFHEIKVEGVPIVTIWKNDIEHSKPEYKKQVEIHSNFNLTNKTLTVTLDKPSKITKISIHFDNKSCDLTSDGSVEIHQDDWQIIDNQVIVTGFNSSYYNFKSPTEFAYPIAAIKSDSVRFNFENPEFCFKNAENVTVYGLPD